MPTVPVTVEGVCHTPPVHAFAAIAPIDLTRMFRPHGPYPGVVGVRHQTGDWNAVGQTRQTLLSDGSMLHEVLTEYNVPHSFAYELTGFSNVLRYIVESARGEWTFTPYGPDTMVRWTYTFTPLNGALIPARLLLAPSWRQYARHVLARAIAIAEEEYGVTPTGHGGRPDGHDEDRAAVIRAKGKAAAQRTSIVAQRQAVIARKKARQQARRLAAQAKALRKPSR